MARQLWQNGQLLGNLPSGGPIPPAGPPGQPLRNGPLPRNAPGRPVYFPQAIQSAQVVGQVLVAGFGQQEWISQVQDGVARLVDTAVRQLAQTQAPAVNEAPLGQGGQYAFAPVTEHNAQQHVAANPAADQRHLGVPQNPAAANQAQAAYEAAQQQYAEAMGATGVPQQVQAVQGATQQMDQFAQLAGVRDPNQPPPPQTMPQQALILPPGVVMPEQQDGGDDGSVSVLW